MEITDADCGIERVRSGHALHNRANRMVWIPARTDNNWTAMAWTTQFNRSLGLGQVLWNYSPTKRISYLERELGADKLMLTNNQRVCQGESQLAGNQSACFGVV